MAWELTCAAERASLLIPHLTQKALGTELEALSGWLDGNLSRKADQLLEVIVDDLRRLQPRPRVVIFSAAIDDEDMQALQHLSAKLDVPITIKTRTAEPIARLALRLLGTLGIRDPALDQLLIDTTMFTGDAALSEALNEVLQAAPQARTFAAYEVVADDKQLLPVFNRLSNNPAWQPPDWTNLGLAQLSRELWRNPIWRLDEFRKGGYEQLRSEPNAYLVRLRIARHCLRCHSREGLAARLDLLEASAELQKHRPPRAWKLLLPHTKDPDLMNDPMLAAHIYGQAGRAAAKLDFAIEALNLMEKNLACLEPAFGRNSRGFVKAEADVRHRLGQLLREHPELPGGYEMARTHIETSLKRHEELGLTRGASMCRSDLGELLLVEGKFEEAQTWFEKAVALDREQDNPGGESRILHQLAILYERTGKFEQALSLLDQAEQAQQKARIGGNLRQRLLNTRERIQDMLGLDHGLDTDPIESLEAISSDEPRTFSIRVTQTARTLRQQNRYAEAEELLRDALTRQLPEVHRGFVWLALANLLLDLRRNSEARQILSQISPHSERMTQELALLTARLEFQEENHQRATEILDNINPAGPSVLRSRIHFSRGRILFAQNKFTEAATEFAASRRYSQASVYATRLALEKEAYARFWANDFEEAIKLARDLASSSSAGKWKLRQIRAEIILGEALSRQGKYREAAEEFERAIALVQGQSGANVFPRVALERRAAKAWWRASNVQAALWHVNMAQQLLDEEDAPAAQRGWVFHLIAIIQRGSGDLKKSEAALVVAEQYARDSDDRVLAQAVAMVRQGDWRHDSWTFDDFELDEEDGPRPAVVKARMLRARGKLDEALKTLAAFEQSPMVDSTRQELLELKLGVLLDQAETGLETEFQVTMDELVGERSESDLTPKLLLLRARALLLSRAHQEAIHVAEAGYRKAVELGEFYSIARAGAVLSKAYGEIGQQQKANHLLEEIASFMTTHERHQFAFDARYSLCRHLIYLRSFPEARKQLEILSSSDTPLSLADETRIQLAHAEIERIEGKWEDALKRVTKIIEDVVVKGRRELVGEAERLRRAILLDQGLLNAGDGKLALDSGSGSLRSTKAATLQIKSLRQKGQHLDAIELAAETLKKEGSSITRTRAIVLHEAAMCHFKVKDVNSAVSYCRMSLDLHTQLGMVSGIPGVRVTLARVLGAQGLVDEAQQQLQEALAENKRLGDHRGIAICEKLLKHFAGETAIADDGKARDMLVLAQTLRNLKRTDEALVLIDKALKRAREDGDTLSEARALGALGINAFNRANFDEAHQHLESAIVLHARLGSGNLGECVHYQARAHVKMGKFDRAEDLLITTLKGRLRAEERQKLEGLLRWVREQRRSARDHDLRGPALN